MQCTGQIITPGGEATRACTRQAVTALRTSYMVREGWQVQTVRNYCPRCLRRAQERAAEHRAAAHVVKALS